MLRPILGLLVTLAIVTPVSAQFTWNGAGANNNWTTDANWGGTGPASGGSATTTLTFGGSTRLTTNQNHGNPFTLNAMTFAVGAGAFSIGGNPLDFDGTTTQAVLTQSANNNISINSATRMAANSRITGSGSGSLTFANLHVDNGSLTLERNITVNTLQLSSLTATNDTVINMTGSASLTLGGNIVFNGSNSSTAPPVVINGRIDLGGAERSISGGYGAAPDPFIDVDINAIISGTGGFRKVGSTTTFVHYLRLNGVNTYIGPTTFEGGSEFSFLGVAGAIPSNSAVTIDIVGADTATVILGSDNSEANSRNQNIGNLSGGGRIRLGNATLTLGNNTATATFSGLIQQDFVGGAAVNSSGSIIKVGAGVQIFSGNNVYSGTTTVNGGTLLLNGQTGTNSGTGTGAVTVNTTGRLGGTGRVAGAVTVNAGGTIMGGDGATATGNPTLNLGNSVSFANTSRTRVVVGGAPGSPVNSRFTTTGALTPIAGGNIMTIDLVNDGTLIMNSSYTITVANYGSTSATSANFTPNAMNFLFQGTPLITVNSTNLVIQFVPVPEPATILGLSAGAMGLAGFIRRRLRKSIEV